MTDVKYVKNKTDTLGKKYYSIWDRQFMLFGSIMNNQQGKLSEEEVWEIWDKCKVKVEEFITELYKKSEEDNGEEYSL